MHVIAAIVFIIVGLWGQRVPMELLMSEVTWGQFARLSLALTGVIILFCGGKKCR